MLVLSRKQGEKITIGDDILVTIVQIRSNSVRIGISAPEHVKVYREELAVQAPIKVSPDGEEIEPATGEVSIPEAIVKPKNKPGTLVLSRKLDEKIVIGNTITIQVVKIDRDIVRLGFEAPREIEVLRAELHARRATEDDRNGANRP